MTMREMQIFLEVARTLNMSTAGKSLYLSQSTVSQSILNIERRYNVQLFRRQSKYLILTKQGKILQDYCHQILELHRRLESTAHRRKVIAYWNKSDRCPQYFWRIMERLPPSMS